MTEVLSQEEIDQLLTAISTGEVDAEEISQTGDQRKIKIYDFKRPDKFSKDQIRTISMIHETFARLTTTGLSAQLRAMAHVHVASVDQLTYEEFIRSIPNPTTLAVIDMEPLKGNAVLEIDPSITFAIIDKLFGGKGEGDSKLQRELTEIESAVIEPVISKLSGQYWYSSVRKGTTTENLMVIKERLNSVFVNIIVEVGMIEVKVRDVLALKIGDFIKLDNVKINDNFIVKVEDKHKFECRPGTIGSKMAVQGGKCFGFAENESISEIEGGESNE